MANPKKTGLITIVGICILVAGVTADEVPWREGASYALMGGSTFQEGCFPPCACPIMASGELLGTCLLIHEPQRATFHTYALEYINWWVVLDDEVLIITGSGVYTMDPYPSPVHRLQLDLSIGGAELQHFDSGFVRGGRDFPDIVATVALNGWSCFDTVLEINAIPNLGCPGPPQDETAVENEVIGEPLFEDSAKHWGRRTEAPQRKRPAVGPRLAHSDYGECVAGSADGSYPWCGADEFKWSVGAGTLAITHAAAAYNCCPADIALSLEMVGDRIRITETEVMPAPCDCMCCYEIESTIVDLPPGPHIFEYCWMDEGNGTDLRTCQDHCAGRLTTPPVHNITVVLSAACAAHWRPTDDEQNS